MAPTPLNDTDLDRLEVLLDSPAFGGEAMRLDEIQAMLCAIVSGPEEIPADVWLAAALGENPAYEDEAQAAEVTDLLVRLCNDLTLALQEGRTIAPILYPVDEACEDYDYEAWADAYVYGCGLGNDWFEQAGKHADDLSGLLEPMFLLNGMLKEDVEKHGEKWFSPAEEARVVAEAEDGLPAIVQALFDFWQSKRATTTVRRDEPKIGRNDPCPCGSGKKFKQCCGKQETLH